VKLDDVVYHLGDFCTRGSAGGHPAVGTKAAQYECQLNGKLVHILGNHDKNNGVNGQGLTAAIMDISHFTAMLIHAPPQHPGEIPDFVDFVLCGHVHERWEYQILENTPIINVGVDVRNYRPVSLQEVLQIYNTIRRKDNGVQSV